MSVFEVKVTAGNPKREEQATPPIEARVDSGSELTWLPKELLEKVGITPRRRRTFPTANKQIQERHVGYAIIQSEGHMTNDEVVFAEPGGHGPAGGVSTLEGFGFMVDNIAHRVFPGTTLVAGESEPMCALDRWSGQSQVQCSSGCGRCLNQPCCPGNFAP